MLMLFLVLVLLVLLVFLEIKFMLLLLVLRVDVVEVCERVFGIVGFVVSFSKFVGIFVISLFCSKLVVCFENNIVCGLVL